MERVPFVVVVAAAAYYILSRLLYLAYSANLGIRPTMHTASRHGTHSLTSLKKDGGVNWKVAQAVDDRTQPCLTSAKLIELTEPLGHSPHGFVLFHFVSFLPYLLFVCPSLYSTFSFASICLW